jgi:hypothetical protein
VEQQFPVEYKAIYKVRSDLAHGTNLLEGDLELELILESLLSNGNLIVKETHIKSLQQPW